VLWREAGRVGTYFVECSAPPRGVEVFYDREASCAAKLQPDDLPWELLLDTRMVHLTGILPALSESCRDIAQEFVRRARKAGVLVSFDVNFRGRLWSAEQARATILPLVNNIDLLLCARRDATMVFGLGEAATSEQLARSLAAQSGARAVVLSDGANGIYAWEGGELLTQPALETQIVDRLGAGDALAAGVIHGRLNGSLRQGLGYGAALAALVLSHHGDLAITTAQEVEQLLQGIGVAIQR
jgi:2-dehydro-3-deoxygluconokinase